jgi:hypothetical protein
MFLAPDWPKVLVGTLARGTDRKRLVGTWQQSGIRYLSQSWTKPWTCSGRGAQASTTRTTSTCSRGQLVDRSRSRGQLGDRSRGQLGDRSCGQLFSRDSDSHTCKVTTMDERTITTPSPKCRLYWCLKVLSSEMDPAEIRLIRWIFIKGSKAFYKNPPTPHPPRAL